MIEHFSERIAENVRQLPPMPKNLIKLRQTAADPNANYDSLVPVLKEDPSLCANVLHMANSALYGVGHAVETVEEAVRYFGMEPLVEFLAVAFSEDIVKTAFTEIQNINTYLSHSRQVSAATGLLTKHLKIGHHDQEVYSVTGLLHDLGRLIILMASDKTHLKDEFLGMDYTDIMTLVDTENEIYGIDHAELGMLVCRKWNFPDLICKGVQHHHKPVIDGKISMEGTIIFLAEIITFTDLAEDILPKAMPPDIIKHLGIDPNLLIQVRREYVKYQDSLLVS